MNEELILYTSPRSRGRIARWMLEEIGRPYRTEWVDSTPAMKSPEYLAINPMGKVPALRHGGAVVTESAAIVAYLAEAFPAAGLAPAPDERGVLGAYYRWFFFAANPLEAAMLDRAIGREVPEDKRPMSGYGSYELVLDTLDSHLAGDGFAAGSKFLAVDVMLASALNFGMQFGALEKRPAFEKYAARCIARPAYHRAAAIDDARIAAQAGQ